MSASHLYRDLTFRLMPVVVSLASLFGLCSTSSADRLILRNLDVLNNVKISKLDEDGVQLDSGKTLTWDQIEAGSITGEGQKAFDAMLKELGDPLYRVRRRLSVGDYRGLLAYAEKIESKFANRTSDPAYWVALGLMWGRMAEGRREAALSAYFRCYEIRRVRGETPPTPGDRQLVIDAATGLCPDLAPIWFDQQAAKTQLPIVLKVIGEMKQPRPPAARIYFASLAIAAGDDERADVLLKDPLTGRAEELRRILSAQRLIAAKQNKLGLLALDDAEAELSIDSKPLALYWRGIAKTSQESPNGRRDGLLDLLRLPAIYGKQRPDLAAAGLHRAMEILEQLGDAGGSVRVRRELLEQYSQTYHAGLQKKPPKKGP